MGLQRHIKVLGIFCRLWHRDGKQHYLDDLPLTLAYSINIAKKYPETQALAELLQMYDIPTQIGKVDISV
jgi:aminoglycoside/choline kinase family phosphotransferase